MTPTKNRPLAAKAAPAPAPRAAAPAPRKPVGATTGPIPKDRATTPVPAPAPKKKTVHITAPVNRTVELDEEENFEEPQEATQAPTDEFAEEGEDLADREVMAETETTGDEFNEFEEETSQEDSEESEAQRLQAEQEELAEQAEAERIARIQAAKKKPALVPPQGAKPKAATAQAPKQAPVAKAPTPTPAKTLATAARRDLEVAAPATAPRESNIQGDLILPRVLLMQATSELVKQRKAYAGQIVRSPSGEVLGGISQPGEPATPVNLVPLTMSESWTIVLADGNKWLGTEPRTPENDSLPWEFVNEDGEDCKRLKTIDLVGLLERDVLAQIDGAELDEDGVPTNLDAAVLLPVGMSFKSTSFKAGKGVSTFFAKVAAAAQANPIVKPYHYMLPIGCEAEANEDGDFFILNTGGTLSSAKQVRELAKGWYNQVKKAVVHLEGERDAEEQAAENMSSRPAPKRQRSGLV